MLCVTGNSLAKISFEDFVSEYPLPKKMSIMIEFGVLERGTCPDISSSWMMCGE